MLEFILTVCQKRPIVSDESPEPAPHPKPTSATSKAPMSAKRKNIVKSEAESEEDVKPAAKRQSGGGRKAAKKPTYVESDEEEGEKEEVKPVIPKNGKPKGKPAKKEPSASLAYDEMQTLC